MTTDKGRQLLGAFVRAHRERLAPEGAAGRRRTPGLRREELAARAGISVTWLTWIEQGRNVTSAVTSSGSRAIEPNAPDGRRDYLQQTGSGGRRDQHQ